MVSLSKRIITPLIILIIFFFNSCFDENSEPIVVEGKIRYFTSKEGVNNANISITKDARAGIFSDSQEANFGEAKSNEEGYFRLELVENGEPRTYALFVCIDPLCLDGCFHGVVKNGYNSLDVWAFKFSEFSFKINSDSISKFENVKLSIYTQNIEVDQRLYTSLDSCTRQSQQVIYPISNSDNYFLSLQGQYDLIKDNNWPLLHGVKYKIITEMRKDNEIIKDSLFFVPSLNSNKIINL